MLKPLTCISWAALCLSSWPYLNTPLSTTFSLEKALKGRKSLQKKQQRQTMIAQGLKAIGQVSLIYIYSLYFYIAKTIGMKKTKKACLKTSPSGDNQPHLFVDELGHFHFQEPTQKNICRHTDVEVSMICMTSKCKRKTVGGQLACK